MFTCANARVTGGVLKVEAAQDSSAIFSRRELMSLKKLMKDDAIKAEVDALIEKATAAALKARNKEVKDAIKDVAAEIKDGEDKVFKKAGATVIKQVLEAIA